MRKKKDSIPFPPHKATRLQFLTEIIPPLSGGLSWKTMHIICFISSYFSKNRFKWETGNFKKIRILIFRNIQIFRMETTMPSTMSVCFPF